MIRILAFASLLLSAFAVPAAAGESPAAGYGPEVWPHVIATISLTKQEMDVFAETADYQQLTYKWKISTGRKGYETPTGDFKPIWADPDHHSSIYENAPMPFSVFFTEGGYAIHGTLEVAHLGHPVSHGCIRLDTPNAELFYDYVNKVGKENTKIVIVN